MAIYTPYPASITSITDWVASLARTIKPISIKGYVSALRSLHVENGWDNSSFKDPRIDLVIKGAKRQYGEGKRNLRLPLTEDILRRIITLIPRDLDGLNFKAALCVGFAAFMHSGEFTWDILIKSKNPSSGPVSPVKDTRAIHYAKALQ